MVLRINHLDLSLALRTPDSGPWTFLWHVGPWTFLWWSSGLRRNSICDFAPAFDLFYSTKSLLTWSRPFSSCRATAFLWGEPIPVQEIIERITSCYGPATTNECSELLMKERIRTLRLNGNWSYSLHRLRFSPGPLVFSLSPDTDSLNFFRSAPRILNCASGRLIDKAQRILRKLIIQDLIFLMQRMMRSNLWNWDGRASYFPDNGWSPRSGELSAVGKAAS